MTKQLRHSLVEGGYMAVIALIAALSSYVGGVGGREIAAGLVIALTPIAKRIYEGYQDGIRNQEGTVLDRDVHPVPIAPVVSERTIY